MLDQEDPSRLVPRRVLFDDVRSADGPLAGVRVVDISTSYAAPTASMYLADLGADVIKVERPSGDDARTWGPPFVGGEAAWFMAANRNKRSVCLDIRTDGGYGVLMRLLAGADVFVENLNPGKLERLGLAPETLRERFPRLIYCAISGFGLTGPDRDLPGYDLIAQARSGLMSLTGAKGGSPQRMSTALSDVAAGTVAALAVCAAIRQQDRTGQGDVVDVALLEADLAFAAPRLASFIAGEPEARPSGGTDSVLAIYQAFETADRPIVLAVGNDAMWQRLCAALALSDLAEDPELATNEGRRARRTECVEVIGACLAGAPAAHWLALLAEHEIPATAIRFLGEVVEDEQVQARGALIEWTHPEAGAVRTVGAPWRLASGPGPTRPSPMLGEHTDEILRELRLDHEAISDLYAKGAAWTSKQPTSSS